MKPNDLVLVNRDGYSHVGEVMSYPTPTQTLMVRMVPGNPLTLRETPVAQIQRLSWTPRFVHYAAVAGRPPFPVDMLRREHAATVNFDLEDLAYAPRDAGLVRLVAKATDRVVPDWLDARWNSFDWTLVHHATERFRHGVWS